MPIDFDMSTAVVVQERPDAYRRDESAGRHPLHANGIAPLQRSVVP